MSEQNNTTGNGLNNSQPNEFSVVLTIIKVVILAIFMLPLVEYSIRAKTSVISTETDQIQIETIDVSKEIEKVTDRILTENVEITKDVQVDNKQKDNKNSCNKSYTLVIFNEILTELIEENELCTPNDFYNSNKHKIPKSAVRNFRKETYQGKTEAKVPAIVNYAVGIVLMVSLGAAVLELYKAKRQPAKKDGKNSLSRKCSLADLTVMKHHRKEMVRRESIMEVPEEHIYSKLGKLPTPLHRQCSFPVTPSNIPAISSSNRGFSTGGRRFSMQATTKYVPVVDGRPAAVLEGRRHSIVSDGRNPMIMMESNRRISFDTRGMIINAVDDASDRRYHGHGRRVHRH
ncbi:uncharacterized protein LOC114332065 [Diabrotica virgifera virgifera]|uniref:Uncharacterized protein LOC114332065 n=1 Tax=Diabrotica virgifera virgifera TaxID=50390 RepID=A0A6P7FS14_DIAVI|nr:uncharacterized protein LOC114332065 [Diabrotica virgifera virgifera]